MNPVSTVKFTYEDYLLFSEDGNRHELIDGEHYMNPAPVIKHQRVSRNLLLILCNFVKKNKLGEVFDAPCDIVFSDVDVVQPDIVFISNKNKRIITEKNVQGPPDLVIEIISETTRKMDKVIKRRLYEKFGVKEYWIIDPVVDSLEVYKPTQEGYKKIAEYEKGDKFSSELLKGLTINLAEIFPA